MTSFMNWPEADITSPEPAFIHSEILASKVTPPVSVTAVFQRKSADGYVAETGLATLVSSRYSSSLNRREAPRTFSSRGTIEEVPGIGSMIGDRFSNQASATCMGVFW